MVNSVSGNYNDWITSLNSRGIKTTNLGKGEANFADYTNALSESLKQEIMASFDCDADYDLQAKLASLYDGNVKQSGDIVNAAKKAGIQVNVQYVKTSYIVDNKADGHYDKNVTNGSIAVYTFKDANGGEIKIADANGNGALESEELFMNEILSGVVSDIQTGGFSGNAGVAQNTQNNMQNGIDTLLAQMEAQIAEQQKMIEEQIAQIKEATLAQLGSFDTAKTETEEAEGLEAENTKAEPSKKDIQKEAKKLIEKEHPTLSDNELNKLAEKIADKVLSTGVETEKAVKAALETLEEQAA